MKRNKKKNKIMLLLILLLGITVGYAAISATLKINGSATVTKQTWNVYWDEPVVTTGSKSMTAPTREADSGLANTKLTWSVTLDLPGDYYEFTVDAVNAGTVDAMITGITPTVSPALPTNPDYIKYSVTYADGIAPAVNHLLAKKTGNTPTTEKYKVRVYYDETVATAASINGMSSSTTYTFTLNITYGQATDDAIPKPTFRLPSGKTKDTLAVGDELCVGDQCFDFIKYDGDDVVMLAKYNLKVGNIYNGSNYTKIGEYTSSDTGYGLQSSETRGYVDGASTYNGTVPFSATNYWNGAASYPVDVYDATNYAIEPDFSTTCDSTHCWQTPGYSVAYYVEQYKTKLTNDYHATIKEARLLTYSEATDSNIGCSGSNCPTTGTSSFITNTTFWLGTAGYDKCVWFVPSDGNFDGYDYYFDDGLVGVRPVIVVEKANL